METRRKSMAPTTSAALTTRPVRARKAVALYSPQEAKRGRRSTTAMTAPAVPEKRGRGRPSIGGSLSKPPIKKAPVKATTKKFQNDDSFVAGDKFDFSGMESPRGVMTRSRRSSVFVGKPPMLTSTTGRSAAKSRAKLDSVMEAPDASFIPHKTPAKKKEPMSEITAEVINKKAATPEKVNSPPLIKAQSPDDDIVFNENVPLAVVKSASKSAKKTVSAKKMNNIRPSRVVISPIKKAALHRAFSGQAITMKSSTAAFPGTPQPTDPGNLLRKNLKRKVEMQLTQKVQELPQCSSPYTLLEGETENGSPVEHFVKMSKKPTNNFVTGTPAPPKDRCRSRILPAKDENVVVQKVETNNAAVNKAIEKNLRCENEDPQFEAANNDQIVTGGLADLCVVM